MKVDHGYVRDTCPLSPACIQYNPPIPGVNVLNRTTNLSMNAQGPVTDSCDYTQSPNDSNTSIANHTNSSSMTNTILLDNDMRVYSSKIDDQITDDAWLPIGPSIVSILRNDQFTTSENKRNKLYMLYMTHDTACKIIIDCFILFTLTLTLSITCIMYCILVSIHNCGICSRRVARRVRQEQYRLLYYLVWSSYCRSFGCVLVILTLTLNFQIT